jgi:hypothetical protein
MQRSLAELKQRVNELIESYGEDTTVAAFIFTPADVFVLDEDYEENYLPHEQAEEVLAAVGDTDYIYEQIGEVIDDEVRRVTRANNDIIRI